MAAAPVSEKDVDIYGYSFGYSSWRPQRRDRQRSSLVVEGQSIEAIIKYETANEPIAHRSS